MSAFDRSVAQVFSYSIFDRIGSYSKFEGIDGLAEAVLGLVNCAYDYRFRIPSQTILKNSGKFRIPEVDVVIPFPQVPDHIGKCK